jgi:DMSO reductase anchor subunit
MVMHEIISEKKQDLWRRPVVFNFFLGGTAAGFYLLLLLFGQNLQDENWIGGGHFVRLIPPALVAAGLLSVAAEAGRPFRGLNLFLNVKHSWMSREVVFAAIFIFLSLVEAMVGGIVLSLLAGCAAVLFLISQAMILRCSSAVPAWNTATVTLLLISSALLNGFGLALLLQAANVSVVGIDLLAYGLGCILLNLLIWVWIVYGTKDGETRQALQPLRSKQVFAVAGVLGLVAPFFGLSWLLILKAVTPASPLASISHVIWAAIILFCGYYRLNRLISGIDYLRPVQVPKLGENRLVDAEKIDETFLQAR